MPDQETIRLAAGSGNVPLVTLLIGAPHNLVPGQEGLRLANAGGNPFVIEMIRQALPLQSPAA